MFFNCRQDLLANRVLSLIECYFLGYFQYREKRLEQEKELLHNQNTWLNTELKTKTDELLALGREKGNEILELKCNLENKKEEVSQENCIFILVKT